MSDIASRNRTERVAPVSMMKGRSTPSIDRGTTMSPSSVSDKIMVLASGLSARSSRLEGDLTDWQAARFSNSAPMTTRCFPVVR